MRDQLLRIPREQRTDQIGDHRTPHIRLVDQRAVVKLAAVTPLRDLWVGLIKAPVFGFIIALTGCFQGMKVEGNSEEVGTRTTAAVVQAIFLVIVLDAVFAVFFSQVGWI